MKAEGFELELDPPSATAQQIQIDVKFRTRSGLEEIKQTLPIDRSDRRSYQTHLEGWNKPPRPTVSESQKKTESR